MNRQEIRIREVKASSPRCFCLQHSKSRMLRVACCAHQHGCQPWGITLDILTWQEWGRWLSFRTHKQTNKAGNVPINVTLRCVRVTTVADEKLKVLHILPLCLALFKRMRLVILTAAWPALQLSTLPHKPTIFGQKLQILSEAFLILLGIQRDITINVHKS